MFMRLGVVHMTLLDYIPKKRPLKLLDIGCSDCMEGEELIRSGVILTGIDQDEETMKAVRVRLSEGKFLTMNAADYQTPEFFDVILLRRPDLILGFRSWKKVFSRLSNWLTIGGLILVTTTGESEAKIALQLFSEIGTSGVELVSTEWENEQYLLRAEAPDSLHSAVDSKRNLLVDELMWTDDQPAWVCDSKTGICSLLSPAEAVQS